jgi:DNA-binding MurR/RpiR family transcriptional regulator
MNYRGAVIDLAKWIIILAIFGSSGFLAHYMKEELRPI